MGIMRSAATVGGFTLVSRLLGFVRDVLIAAVLGAGPMADAFFVAFKLPNLFRRLFAEGAFNAAFVPLFARGLERNGLGAARGFAEQALGFLLLVLLVLTVAAEAFMPAIMRVLAPGFAADPEKLGLAVVYGRITFPYLLALSLAALCGGVLNALYRYAAAAAAPIMLNVVLILALAAGAPLIGHPGAVLAWAVFGAGMLQLIWLVWACGRAGMVLRLPRPRLTPAVRRLLLLMLPAAGSAGVIHINLLIGNIIASHQPGAVSYLYYADRLYQLPLGVIGIAVGVVLLPELARRLRGGDTEAAHTVHNQAIAFAMLLTLPAAGALVVLAGPLVAVLFERGAFGDPAAQATAAAVVAFSAGLPAYVLVKVLTPGFFAREDTATPLVCAAAGVAVNVALSLILFGAIGHVGIALATAAAAWIQVVLLGAILIRRGLLAVDPTLTGRLTGLVAATLGMMLALRAGLWAAQNALHGGFVSRAGATACLVLGGATIYFALVFAFRAADPAMVRAALRRRGGA